MNSVKVESDPSRAKMGRERSMKVSDIHINEQIREIVVNPDPYGPPE